VDAFLHQIWGYDPDRTWRVAGIQSTAAPGVSRVTVFVLEKAPGAQIQELVLMVTPDGNHAIEGYNVIPFGEKPFAANRELLRKDADGPFRGPANKEFEIVEFVDLQCPHCKAAQGIVDQLAKDFPNAHIAIELFPLVSIHPSAYKAAQYAVCAQEKSTDAFFEYIHEVFETQDRLTPTTDDALLKAAATRAGLDSNAVAACASTPAARDSVDAQMRLAVSAGVDQTPLLAVNGRMLPDFNAIPYEQLKRIIEYQEKLDGLDRNTTAKVAVGHAASQSRREGQ
jgi:protein-disulfide isomerase